MKPKKLSEGLWPKQRAVLEFALSRDAAGLLCEQRTGKTYITLALIEELMSRGPFVGVLVGVLNNLDSTWADGIAKQLPDLAVHRDWESFRDDKGSAHRILLINFEGLGSVIDKLVRMKALNWAGIDEGQKIYSRGTKQSRAAGRLSKVPRRLLLTGTPIEKRPVDMWAQMRFLVPDLLGKWSDFEDRFMDWRKIDLAGTGIRPGSPIWQQKMLQQRILKGKAKFREDRLDEFVELFSPHCIRIDKEDVGIKRTEVVVREVRTPPTLAGYIDQMSEDSVVRLNGGKRVMAGLPVTRVVKLRQLASGFIYDEEGSLVWLSDFKVREAVKLFESLPKPVVIFSAFVPELLAVHDELSSLGYDVGLLYGKIKKKLRPDQLRAFQAGQLDAIVCQERAGGVGVDLWKANSAICMSINHSYIDWDQMLSRLDSKAKEKPSRMYYLSASGSIDTELYDLVVLKGLTGKAVLNRLKGASPWRRKPKLKQHRSPRRMPKPPSTGSTT